MAAQLRKTGDSRHECNKIIGEYSLVPLLLINSNYQSLGLVAKPENGAARQTDRFKFAIGSEEIFIFRPEMLAKFF